VISNSRSAADRVATDVAGRPGEHADALGADATGRPTTTALVVSSRLILPPPLVPQPASVNTADNTTEVTE
jgi:hypothetical protein